MRSSANRKRAGAFTQTESITIKDDRTKALHYMRKTIEPQSSLIARLTGEDTLGVFGITLQNSGPATRYGALAKRLRMLRRQASEGNKNYDLSEHYELSRYMRVFKQEFQFQNRIFYQNYK